MEYYWLIIICVPDSCKSCVCLSICWVAERTGNLHTWARQTHHWFRYNIVPSVSIRRWHWNENKSTKGIVLYHFWYNKLWPIKIFYLIFLVILILYQWQQIMKQSYRFLYFSLFFLQTFFHLSLSLNWLIQVCLIIVVVTTEVRHIWINQFDQ